MQLTEYKSKFDSCDFLVKGGQKKVYKVSCGKEFYALKLIDDCEDKRVLQEIDILKKLTIKGIPKIFDYGLLENGNETILFILEEFIDSSSLRTRIKNLEIITLRKAFIILKSLLEIEIELEKHGIIHRDIKPDNIIFNDEEEVFLVDFGVAKILGSDSLTAFGVSYAPHTPGYAPSEQIMNDRMLINSKTDLYQIGVTIYELLSGSNPFRENVSDVIGIHYRTINIIPPPLSIPGDKLGYFSGFVSMLMAKNQSQRPENAVKALSYLYSFSDSLDMEGN